MNIIGDAQSRNPSWEIAISTRTFYGHIVYGTEIMIHCHKIY